MSAGSSVVKAGAGSGAALFRMIPHGILALSRGFG